MEPTTPQGGYNVRRSRGAEERALARRQEQFAQDNPELVALKAEVAALRAQLKPYTGCDGIRVDGHIISLSNGGGGANGGRGGGISATIAILDLNVGGFFKRYTQVLYSGTETTV